MADPSFAWTRECTLIRAVSPFYQNFLHDGRSWFKSTAPDVHLAAFGKHPGWNDHMEDIGLETESLLTAKRLLYLEGIAANISAGTWEQCESTRLPNFNHVFCWQRGDQYLLGRMWSSRDGKGRSHFPMILCAHIVGTPAPLADDVRQCLEEIRRQCIETVSAEAVRGVINEGLRVLRQLPREIDSTVVCQDLAIGDLPELADFHRGRFRARKNPPSRVLRTKATTRKLNSWITAFRERLDPDAPFLLVMPLHDNATWLDLIAGEPTPQDFISLRTAGPG
jgi:hypothetical protein